MTDSRTSEFFDSLNEGTAHLKSVVPKDFDTPIRSTIEKFLALQTAFLPRTDYSPSTPGTPPLTPPEEKACVYEVTFDGSVAAIIKTQTITNPLTGTRYVIPLKFSIHLKGSYECVCECRFLSDTDVTSHEGDLTDETINKEAMTADFRWRFTKIHGPCPPDGEGCNASGGGDIDEQLDIWNNGKFNFDKRLWDGVSWPSIGLCDHCDGKITRKPGQPTQFGTRNGTLEGEDEATCAWNCLYTCFNSDDCDESKLLDRVAAIFVNVMTNLVLSECDESMCDESGSSGQRFQPPPTAGPSRPPPPPAPRTPPPAPRTPPPATGGGGGY